MSLNSSVSRHLSKFSTCWLSKSERETRREGNGRSKRKGGREGEGEDEEVIYTAAYHQSRNQTEGVRPKQNPAHRYSNVQYANSHTPI